MTYLSENKFLKLVESIEHGISNDTDTSFEEIVEGIKRDWRYTPRHVFYHDLLLSSFGTVQQKTLSRFYKAYGLYEELPMIRDFVLWSNMLQNINLEDYSVVAVQHILGSNFQLFRLLQKAGIPYRKMHVVGKAYSANPLAVGFFKMHGVDVQVGVEAFRNDLFYKNVRDYDSYLYDQVQSCFSRALSQNPRRKILILDDGAMAIKYAKSFKRKLNCDIIAVEQTRFGSKYIKSIELDEIDFPVINVAESKSKLVLESPLIGKSIVSEIYSRLKSLGENSIASQPTALVVGYGSIGFYVAEGLKRDGFEVQVCDNDVEKAEKAKADGYTVVDVNSGLSNSKLIVGCTGEKWFFRDHIDLLLDGFVLASGTSSDVEFQTLILSQGQREVMDMEGTLQTALFNVHGDFKLKNGKGNSGWLLNSGYPVNFDGSIDPIEPRYIQLTRTLMLSAVVQAFLNRKKNGLIEFDQDHDAYLTKHFYQFSKHIV